MARKYTKNTDDPLTGTKLTKQGKSRKPPKYQDPSTSKSAQIKRVLELAAVDTPVSLIARTTDLTTSKVYSILTEYKEIFNQLEKLPELRQRKRDLIEATMFSNLELLSNKKKQSKATLKESAYTFQVLHNATRLESNQSTSNSVNITFTGDKVSLDDIDA